MDSSGRCGFAEELEAAAAEQQRKGERSAGNSVAYAHSAVALRQVAFKHAKTCERCQTELLVGDEAARHFEVEALTVIGGVSELSGPAHSLAVAVIALVGDRRARVQLAALGESR